MKRVAQSENQRAEKGKRGNTAGQIIPRGEDTWLVRIFTGREGKLNAVFEQNNQREKERRAGLSE